MKAFSWSRTVPCRPGLLGVLALFSLTACATAGGAGEGNPSDVEGVNTGYGTVDRDHLVGSVSTVQGEDEQTERPRTLVEMLSRIPGVQVSTLQGDRISVRIRGNSSFQGGQEPLYVLDGMVIQGLDGLNPSTIQSISVLKDADATAIYGSRGANGVILVKTKRELD